jgi:hypothetical protein
VLAAFAETAGGGEQRFDQGRAGDDAPVDGLRDCGCVPADLGDRVDGEEAEFGCVAARAAEDGALAPLAGLACTCRRPQNVRPFR